MLQLPIKCVIVVMMMSMDHCRNGMISSFYVGGLLVLASYIQLYLNYTRFYSESEKRKVWAIWYHEDIAWIGIFSGALSAMGFVYFSVYITTSPNSCEEWMFCSYILFLLFSAIYAPLIELERQAFIGAWAILLDLLIVAGSVIALNVWTQLHFSWTDEPLLNLSILWLAMHCTVLDFGLWGYTWSHGWIWDEDPWSGAKILRTFESLHDKNGSSIGETDEDPRFMIGDV